MPLMGIPPVGLYPGADEEEKRRQAATMGGGVAGIAGGVVDATIGRMFPPPAKTGGWPANPGVGGWPENPTPAPHPAVMHPPSPPPPMGPGPGWPANPSPGLPSVPPGGGVGTQPAFPSGPPVPPAKGWNPGFDAGGSLDRVGGASWNPNFGQYQPKPDGTVVGSGYVPTGGGIGGMLGGTWGGMTGGQIGSGFEPMPMPTPPPNSSGGGSDLAPGPSSPGSNGSISGGLGSLPKGNPSTGSGTIGDGSGNWGSTASEGFNGTTADGKVYQNGKLVSSGSPAGSSAANDPTFSGGPSGTGYSVPSTQLPGSPPAGSNSLGDLAKSYQQQTDAANAANNQRYNDILGGYDKALGLATSELTGLSQQNKTDTNALYDTRRGSAEQNLISRGLGNTTVRSSIDRGITTDQAAANARINDQNKLQRLGALSGLQSDRLGFMERRNDAPPDISQLAMLAQGVGQSGTPNLPTLPPGSGITASPQPGYTSPTTSGTDAYSKWLADQLKKKPPATTVAF